MPSGVDIETRERLDGFLERNLNKQLLRFTTAGSIDDGKSTLIGRLLHDSKTVYEDQLASIQNSRINRAGGQIDFSLLTDGLRAEREQGITIDVAYRYFSTSRRKFIIADTPGHEQYTRNMATGASTADLAVILVDATKGLLPQTRRHAYIASLLGISHVLAAINKLDLVDYREDVFRALERDFAELAERLGMHSVQCIPISALKGDNVVTPSASMPWYSGPTFLEHLETVVIEPAVEMEAIRFPIQSVIRPDANFRGFAGRVASGVIHPGDAVLALPSRQQTNVKSIVSYDGELDQAVPLQSVVLTLDDEIDLSRGDVLVSSVAPPHVSNRFAAMAVWLHPQPMEKNRTYLAKHAGRYVKINATSIRFKVDVNALREHPADQLEMNGIALVEFETSKPLFFDPYDQNRTMGSFILVDPLSNATVGAAMIRESLSQKKGGRSSAKSSASHFEDRKVAPEERYLRHGHRPAVFAVGNNRVFAESLERVLFERHFEVVLVRHGAVLSSAPIDISALWSAGAVVIVCSENISPVDLASLRATAGKFLFELHSTDSANASEELLEQALGLAETLRI